MGVDLLKYTKPHLPFDKQLELLRSRGLRVDGLQQVEIGLRVTIGHTLGKRSPTAHLDPANLGAKANRLHHCFKQETHYEVWRRQYDQLQQKALKGKQEFVLHFADKYDGTVPIWAAVEFMTMGSLVCLLDLSHLAFSADAPVDHKVYFHAATTAYLLKMIDPDTTWPTSFVEVTRTFPESVHRFGLTPQTSMGFPNDWEYLDLWIRPMA